MKVLLTGYKGFVGAHLHRKLLEAGHVVIIHDYRQYNILAINDLMVPCDAVINCAGETQITERMVYSNLDLVQTILAALATHVSGNPDRRFIQIGSSSEVGPIEGARAETTFCLPSNLYEATKLAATNLCLGYANQFDIDIAVARPFSLYGPANKDRVLLSTLYKAWADDKTFTCYKGGHDWVHINDFCDGILALLGAPKAVTQGQIFNFGSGISTSNAEFVHMFNRVLGGNGIKVEYKNAKLRPYDVEDWKADTTKTWERLGWRTTTSLFAGIADYVTGCSVQEEGWPGL